MLIDILIFVASLVVLVISSSRFTASAEKIGNKLGMPGFVIGVFIIGIGTSIPELVSGILAVQKGSSEILPANVTGSNISNLLLIMGLAVVFNRKKIHLKSSYLYIDLHFLLGSFIYFVSIAYDGHISFMEAWPGVLIFIIYSVYLIRGDNKGVVEIESSKEIRILPHIMFLLLGGTGIYFGAEYTVSSIQHLATAAGVPESLVALTALSLGTTLPELSVNIAAIRKGNAELAVGNVLGSSVFNTLAIAPTASLFGDITVSPDIAQFPLAFMAVCGLIFYLLTQDKNISIWEGLMFVSLYILFIVKTAIL